MQRSSRVLLSSRLGRSLEESRGDRLHVYNNAPIKAGLAHHSAGRHSSNRSSRYRAYVDHLHAWAADPAAEATTVGVDAERLEWVLFRHNGKAPIEK
jgi:hypothetical protein